MTLSRAHPTLTGARWLIGVPYSLDALRNDAKGDGEDLIVYDKLGAGTGSRIGFSEGGEAAAPFNPEKKPVDAFCACILDCVTIAKAKGGNNDDAHSAV